jgi:hypothetical protein
MADPHDQGTGGQSGPRPDHPILSDPSMDALSTGRPAGSPLPRSRREPGTTPRSTKNGESRYPPGPQSGRGVHVRTPTDAPDLTPGAARVLLRVLLDAAGNQVLTPSSNHDEDEE